MILKGRPIAERIRENVAERVDALGRRGVAAKLGIVLAGDDAASGIYTRSLEKACAAVGISVEVAAIPGEDGGPGVERAVGRMAEDAATHGILVQQPLPPGVSRGVIERIPTGKDVDGATTESMGLLVLGRDGFAPCTPLGVIEILRGWDVPIAGRDVVIVGRSAVVGRPLANLLVRKTEWANATVTICHTGTRDLGTHTRRAEILVAAMGSPRAISADMVSERAVVVDVGVNRIEDPASDRGYRVVGDVDFDGMNGKVNAITPVPGGVGSLTTALLLRNTVEAAEKVS